MPVSMRVKLALFIAVILWASAFVGIRAGLTHFSPGGLALLRFLVASFGMFIIYMARTRTHSLTKKDLFFALLTGVIGIGFYNIALNYGELTVPAGIASFIVSQSPVITTIIAIFFLQERITMVTALGMLICGLGVGMIALHDTSAIEFYLGIFYIAIATFVGSLYSIFQKSLLKKYAVIDLTAYAMWGGTLVLLIFIPDLMVDLQHASWQSLFTVIYLGVFPAVIAYLAWGYVLTNISASQAVSYLYMTPIAATAIGWLWLDEIPAWLALAGGLIALLGVSVVNHSFKKPQIDNIPS